MNKEELFAIWAPDDSPWSRWVKPVLFAHLDADMSHSSNTEPAGEINWSPSPSHKVALVLDLPGAEGVTMGVALARLGYRPVPLYNALPLPVGHSTTADITAAVNVGPILSALRMGAELLARTNIPMDAPPAFLLDANRCADGRKVTLEEFDNRSISFTTDFPSANFLAAHGVQRVMLIQNNRMEPQPDLSHSLRRWQDGGLKLERMQLGISSSAEPFEVARPTWYGAMFQRVLLSLGLRRADGGGFGAWVTPPAAGG